MKDAKGHGSNAHGGRMTPVQEENAPFVSRLGGKHYLEPNDPRGLAHTSGIEGSPKLQRRHFEAIAAELRAAPDAGSPEHSQRVSQMADKLATTNPGFRRDFFIKAATGGGYTNKSRGRTSGMGKADKIIEGMRGRRPA